MSIELAARVRLRPACTPVCHMVPVTYVRTHISPPVLCNAFESYLHLNPCLLVILPYCHFSHIFPKEEEKFVSHPSLMCLHLYSYHFTWDQQPHSIARHPICHFIKMDCTQSQDAANAATGDLNHNTKSVLLIQKKNLSDFGFNFPQMTISKLASLILQIKTTI